MIEASKQQRRTRDHTLRMTAKVILLIIILMWKKKTKKKQNEDKNRETDRQTDRPKSNDNTLNALRHLRYYLSIGGLFSICVRFTISLGSYVLVEET